MKIISKSVVILFTILFLFCPFSFAETKFNEQIKSEDGSTFEKLIAKMIGGIAQTVFDFASSDEANVGFKDYDELIFNNQENIDSLSPFSHELWKKIMQWYKIFAGLSETLIVIATILIAYRIIRAGNNVSLRNEAKDSFMRLFFGGASIALAPVFVRFLLFLNNSLVYILIKSASSNLGDLLGESMLTSIKTGNAITTAIVISMFVYLFLKLNIKFIVRQFTLIVFTIFTPISISLWIINKNTTAMSIWAGQIIMNVFMQFIYCFLFLIYINFLPSSGGWAISLIWSMMLLPMADALQNSFQNLTSRIAGVDNEQMTNKAVGASANLMYGLGAMKQQFIPNKSNLNSNSNNSGSSNGGNSFVTRVKDFVNPTRNLTPEKDADGNTNPIRNVVPSSIAHPQTNNNIAMNKTNTNTTSNKSFASKAIQTGAKMTSAYLKMGKNLAEGDFSSFKNNKQGYKNNLHSTAYINNQFKIQGEKNGFKEQSEKQDK